MKQFVFRFCGKKIHRKLIIDHSRFLFGIQWGFYKNDCIIAFFFMCFSIEITNIACDRPDQ